MVDSNAPQDTSHTFRFLKDNPLRTNGRETFNSKTNYEAGSVSLLFRRLEKSITKEIQAYWDLLSLSEYLATERIPRGLRVKKFPTFELFDESLKKQWTNTLPSCSRALMDIIIISKNKAIEVLQKDISELQEALKPLQGASEFLRLDQRLNEKLNCLENEIIMTKKKKMLRDKMDYDTNNVYVWKGRHHWSGASQSTAGIRKHVSFSDTKTGNWDDTMEASESDMSPAHPSTSNQQERSTPLPPKNGGSKHKQHKGGQNKNTGGHARDVEGSATDGLKRYPSRRQARKL